MSDQFAFCSVSISPLRANASDSSEMVSQLLFGELLTVLEVDKQWRKVRSEIDQYIGWLDEKCIHFISDNEKNKWEKERMPLFNSTAYLNSVEGQILLTKGAYIGSDATFSIGKLDYQLNSLKIEPSTEISEIANSYLNSPYLWGGKTLFGIDCSGFTQMVFRFLGVYIKRDASQQVNHGESVPIKDRKEGDLAFFINDKGKIHHVGIVLNDNKIIHAHGWLRIDDLTDEGIISRNGVGFSHKLNDIKRLY